MHCTPTAPAGVFSIDDQGRVRLAASLPANVQSCSVTVRVSDGALRTDAMTEVVFNRPPKVTDQQITLPASIPLQHAAHSLFAQDDGVPDAALSWSLLAQQGPESPFIVTYTGSVVATKPLAAPATYTLSVKACDAMPLCGTGKLVINTTTAPGSAQGLFRDGFE